MLLKLFLLALAGLVRLVHSEAIVGQPLRPDDSFIANDATGGSVVLANGVGWGDAPVVRSLEATQLQNCAEACRKEPSCLLFDHCDVPENCTGVKPHIAYHQCRLLRPRCTAVPLVLVAGTWIKRSGGFPLRYTPPEVPGYTTLVQGITGSDLQCPESLLPGRCAYGSVQAAAAACNSTAACRSVVVYFNGTDGCSGLVAMLTSADASSAEFRSPTVAMLVKKGDGAGGSGEAPSADVDSSGGLSGSAIAGIAVGAAALAALLVGAVAWAVLRQRRRRRQGQACSSAGTGARGEGRAKLADSADSGKAAEEGCSSDIVGGGIATIIGGEGSGGGGGFGRPDGGPGHVGSSGGGIHGSKGRGSAPACTSSSSGGAGSSGEGGVLPELAQHIAACEAQSSQAGGGGPQELSIQPAMLSADSLSDALRDWLVDVEDIAFLRRSDGGLQELGRGASGVVFKAVFRGEVVAAKQFDLGSSKSTQEAFVREAERLHSLRHAHIVALYGVALSGSTGILLMEFCSGRDLMKVLELTASGSQERLFSWHRRGRRIAYDVAKALNFLHARGCVHMDVKSSNVLLTGNGTAKLADIGLSRMQHGTYLSDLPLVGTFAWIAPEVLMGGQNCTCAVDLFGFGVVLWEIITGEKPKRGHLRAPRVPEECPQEVSDLMMECLSVDPAGRPTAQQAMQRLRQLGGGGGADGKT